jgi:hypothetical protein
MDQSTVNQMAYNAQPRGGKVTRENSVAFAQANISIAAELCDKAREVRAESARLCAEARRLQRPRRVRLRGLVLFGAAEDVAP